MSELTGHIFAFVTANRVKWEATAEELATAEGDDVTPDDIRQRYADGWHTDRRTGKITYDGDGSGDYNPDSDTVRLEEPIEENGWVDPRWSMYTLYDSRNDVRPVVDCDLSDRETLEGEIADALNTLEGGPVDNGDGTFYSADSYTPNASNLDDRGNWSYSYALHFRRKFLGANGYVEVPWHPVKDGGFTL